MEWFEGSKLYLSTFVEMTWASRAYAKVICVHAHTRAVHTRMLVLQYSAAATPLDSTRFSLAHNSSKIGQTIVRSLSPLESSLFGHFLLRGTLLDDVSTEY
jgi:hypothetical protein